MRQPGVTDVESLMKAAKLGKIALDRFTKRLAEDFGGKAVTCPLKERAKVLEKMRDRGVKKDANQIFDVARSTALYVTERKFDLVRRKLESIHSPGNVDTTVPKIRCVRIKDRYKDGGGAMPGYSDMQCILQVPIGGGYKAHLVELQVNLNSASHHKHLVHALYDLTRISCEGEIPAAKLLKVQNRLKRLERLMEENHFFHNGGPWKKAAEAKKLYKAIVAKVEKLTPKKRAIDFSKEECIFCSILQELVYPHLYKREMRKQRVLRTIVLAGVERTMLLPALEDDVIATAEKDIFELAQKMEGVEYKRAFPQEAHAHIDKWVASEAARTAIRIKQGK